MQLWHPWCMKSTYFLKFRTPGTVWAIFVWHLLGICYICHICFLYQPEEDGCKRRRNGESPDGGGGRSNARVNRVPWNIYYSLEHTFILEVSESQLDRNVCNSWVIDTTFCLLPRFEAELMWKNMISSWKEQVKKWNQEISKRTFCIFPFLKFHPICHLASLRDRGTLFTHGMQPCLPPKDFSFLGKCKMMSKHGTWRQEDSL